MAPTVIVFGVGLFFLGLLLHVLVWHLWPPKRHLIALAGVFSPGWIFFSAALAIRGHFGPLLPADWPAVSLLFAALTCAYIQTYPALQALSPSLLIVLLVGNSMPDGLARDQILASVVDPKKQLEDRIGDLIAAKLLIQDKSDRLTLSSTALVLVVPFSFLRKALGLNMGQG